MTGWTEEGLIRSWKALSNQASDEDWRFVRLTNIGDVYIEAGCHFPLAREAIIVSFPGSWPVNVASLPDGKGFDITCIEGQSIFSERSAIAIVRRTEGLPDIFAIIAVDLLRLLESKSNSTKFDLIEAFLERVREWQHFMSRTHRPLSAESQIGLLGELWLLRILLNTALNSTSLECWLGPLRSAQDFHIHAGAIEVKSTASRSSFLARISSIEQLDTEKCPAFLCAFRFEESSDGVSLVDIVSELRAKFNLSGNARKFEALLMVMGYLDEHSLHYGRTYKLSEQRIIRIEGDTPRLIRTNLPAAIRSASYVIDIEAINANPIDIKDMLNEFGLN